MRHICAQAPTRKEEIVKSRSLFVVAVVVAMSLLTACGESGDSKGSADAAPAVVNGTDSDYGIKVLKCGEGLMDLDVPIGSHQELDGTTYNLSQKTKKDYKGTVLQRSATLTVKLNDKTALPALIVHTVRGEKFSDAIGPLDDKPLAVRLGAGASGNFTLPTSTYTEYPTMGDRISSVTLCLDLT